jgi:hypothetical protein
MNNLMLEMLSEFISNNYDMLKDDYNKLSKEDKSNYPSALFFIAVFDRVLTEQHKQNLKNEPKIIPQENKIITLD